MTGQTTQPGTQPGNRLAAPSRPGVGRLLIGGGFVLGTLAVLALQTTGVLSNSPTAPDPATSARTSTHDDAGAVASTTPTGSGGVTDTEGGPDAGDDVEEVFVGAETMPDDFIGPASVGDADAVGAEASASAYGGPASGPVLDEAERIAVAAAQYRDESGAWPLNVTTEDAVHLAYDETGPATLLGAAPGMEVAMWALIEIDGIEGVTFCVETAGSAEQGVLYDSLTNSGVEADGGC